MSASINCLNLPPSLTSKRVSPDTLVNVVDVCSKLAVISLYCLVKELIISLFSCCQTFRLSTLLLSWSKFSWINLFISEFICFWNSSVTLFITSTRASVLLFLRSSENSSNFPTSRLFVSFIFSSISSTSLRNTILKFLISSDISFWAPAIPLVISRHSPMKLLIEVVTASTLSNFLENPFNSPILVVKEETVSLIVR